MAETQMDFRCALLGSDWRWRLAHQIVDGRPVTPRWLSPELIQADRTLQLAIGYLRAQAAGASADDLARQHAEITAVLEMSMKPPIVDRLKLYCLADADHDYIARQAGAPRDQVALWESIFFCVRPLLHVGSAISVIVDTEFEAGDAALAAQMRLAIGGGVLAVEAMQRRAAGQHLSRADEIYQRMLELELTMSKLLRAPLHTEAARTRVLQSLISFHREAEKLAFAKERLRARLKIAEARLEIARLNASPPQQNHPDAAHAELAVVRPQEMTATDAAYVEIDERDVA